MLNVEGRLRSHIQKSLGVPAFVAVPRDMPAGRFATVERTGGDTRTKVSERATVVVDWWGASRADAFELATEGDEAVMAFVRENGVAKVSVTSACAHMPDVESRRERYESTYSIVIYKEV